MKTSKINTILELTAESTQTCSKKESIPMNIWLFTELSVIKKLKSFQPNAGETFPPHEAILSMRHL